MIQEASESIVLSDWKIYLYEIFYNIGYAKSYIQTISEGTYKAYKQRIVNNLKEIINAKIHLLPINEKIKIQELQSIS